MKSEYPEEQERFTRRLGYLEHLRHSILDRFATQCGLYAGQPPILFILHREGGSKTQNEIAQRLRVSPASLATSIKRMEKAGLLRKESHPTDQRRNLITLTDEGNAIVESCRANFEAMDQCMLSALTDEETEQFAALLQKIICNMEMFKKNQTEENSK